MFWPDVRHDSPVRFTPCLPSTVGDVSSQQHCGTGKKDFDVQTWFQSDLWLIWFLHFLCLRFGPTHTHPPSPPTFLTTSMAPPRSQPGASLLVQHRYIVHFQLRQGLFTLTFAISHLTLLLLFHSAPESHCHNSQQSGSQLTNHCN